MVKWDLGGYSFYLAYRFFRQVTEIGYMKMVGSKRPVVSLIFYYFIYVISNDKVDKTLD